MASSVTAKAEPKSQSGGMARHSARPRKAHAGAPAGMPRFLVKPLATPRVRGREKAVPEGEAEQEARRLAGQATARGQFSSAAAEGSEGGGAAAGAPGRPGGEPLPPAIRSRLAQTFRVNLGGVRVRRRGNGAARAEGPRVRAFAYGSDIFLGPGESPEDLPLMAHEVAHVVQQQGVPAVQHWTPSGGSAYEQEAHQAAAAAVRRLPFTVRLRTGAPRVQRLGIGDALDYFADKANLIPGFRMFTIVLGVNPINMSRVERSAANILRALIEFIPGGALITQALDKYGVFDKVGKWVEQQISALAITGSAIKQAISKFLDSLSWRDIFDLGGVWERAKRIFTDPIDRIINFVKGLVTGILGFIREAILRPLAKLAEGTAGYDLLKAVLGEDPVTGDPYPQTADTLIGGFMKLIGQEEIYTNIKKAKAVPRAFAWFKKALSGLIALVKQIPGLFLQALQSLELADIVVLPRAFAKVARVFGGFLGRFIKWAGSTIWTLLQIIFEVVAPAVIPYLKKAGAAFRTILKNPVGFGLNLVRAAKMGFERFAKNIGSHLKKSLIDWITGSLSGAGVYIPKSFAIRELIKFVLSVLGLTWQKIRQKLVKVIGEPAMKALEVGFDLVVTLIKDGPAAAWEKIKEYLTNLKEMVMEGIMSFVTDKIVTAAVTKLLSMLSPVGAFIQAIIAIYNTVMFFVERLKQIAQVAMAFIDSIAAIAKGVLDAAASRVERTLAGLLSLVISFLARLVGLGKVGDAVIKIINKLRSAVDKAIDKVIQWIVKTAKKILGKLTGKGKKDERTNAQKQADLDKAVAEAQRFLEDEKLDSDDVKKRLAALKTKYKLSRLDLVSDTETEADETDHIEGEINPSKKGPKVKKLKRHKSKFVTRERGKYVLKREFQDKTFTRDRCYGKSYRTSVYDWKNRLLSKPLNQGGLRHPTVSDKYFYEGAYYENKGNTIASVDHKPMVAEHWNSNGRKTTQAVRKDFFNDLGHLAIVPLTKNSEAGAVAGQRYQYEVTQSFRGPGE